MKLAKPRIDIGFATNHAPAALAFWQNEIGLPFDYTQPIRRGYKQHRHDLCGSILKINQVYEPLPDNPPSGYRELLIARDGITAPQSLLDPEGNRVSLMPRGMFGIERIGIRLGVRNVEAHRRFYVEALGLPQGKSEAAGGAMTFLAGDTVLIVEPTSDAPHDASFEGKGWRYITFQVFDVDREHAFVLAHGGVEARAPVTLGTTARVSMVRDPDGNWIELSQRASITGSLEPGGPLDSGFTQRIRNHQMPLFGVVFFRKNLYLSRLNATGMFMKTANKIAIARALHHLVRSFRGIAGRPDRGVFSRRGVLYELDLSQGIDFAIYLGGMFERSTAVALARLTEPSALVLDIGANIGAHTLHLAGLVGSQGRVMAFEPTDFAFRKLRRNLDLNPSLASRVEAFHCFLTASDGASVPGAIYSSWPLSVEEGLHAKHLGREMRTDSAQARSLDCILSERADRKVQLVKLDVDGFECDVLRGATSLLRDTRPIFVMELAPYVLEERGASLDQLLSYFIPNGYVVYDERTQKRLPYAAKELQRMVGDGESMNVIARVD